MRAATLPEVDFVVSAIVGVAGLEATYAAVMAGKPVGLANKECMVAAGEILTRAAREKKVPLLPIDSEHNAIHQCMRAGTRQEVKQIWLTASGGPFRQTAAERVRAHHGGAGPETSDLGDGAAHHHRFGDAAEQGPGDYRGLPARSICRPRRCKVTVHPQSTVHSLVEYVDGSILAQISVTDMRLPILYALSYPERVESELTFDMRALADLHFEAAGSGAFSLPAAGLRGGGGGRCSPHRAECVR